MSPRLRALALIALAAAELGLSPSSTCAGPFGASKCHDRDPAHDHDGQEPTANPKCRVGTDE